MITIALTFSQIAWLIVLYWIMNFVYSFLVAATNAAIKTWKARRENKSIDS